MDVRQHRQLALMLAPYALGLGALIVAPALVTFALALTEYDLIRAPRFIGLDNVRELFGDEVFRIALQNSLVFAAVAVPLRLGAALGLALLLHRRRRGVGAARTAGLLPTVVPDVAYGLLWLWLLNPLYGPLTLFLAELGPEGRTIWGLPLPQFLTDANDARAAIVLMSVFTIGEGFLVLLAARQAVPAELYELAAIEDATAWGVFRRLTLPLIAPVLVLLLLRDTILSFQFNFVPALVVTDGGPPLYATTYLPLFVYREGFEYLRYGYAAAATIVMFAVTAALVAAQWRVLQRWRPVAEW
jgi:multiple sugar transport system permease protein